MNETCVEADVSPVGVDDAVTDVFQRISRYAEYLKVAAAPEEVAELASRLDFGEGQLAAVEATFAYLAERRHESSIETLLKMSRLPKKAPKTFGNFDFTRIQGRDVAALRSLPTLSSLYAGKNIAFIGPGGIGKTHLAQAYGRECCLRGHKTYYLKATELRDRLRKASASTGAARLYNTLVKPSCLIIDEVGRCVFDKECTDLLFDVIDRRYEKEGPNTLILTSNAPVSSWDQFFTGDETLLCALDRVFDRASVFVMRGASFRGAECETFSVDAVPSVTKVNGKQ